MNLITREELHRKLERGDDFKLVMTLSRFAFEAKHIPSSINFATPDEAVSGLHRPDDIVVYCGATSTAPRASIRWAVAQSLQRGKPRRQPRE